MSVDGHDFDLALKVCGDRFRRVVLGVLASEGRELTARDLAHAVAEHNHHLQLGQESSAVLAEIQVSLHHGHIPLLADAGLIDYNQKRKLVVPTERLRDRWPSLSTIIELDPRLDLPLRLGDTSASTGAETE